MTRKRHNFYRKYDAEFERNLDKRQGRKVSRVFYKNHWWYYYEYTKPGRPRMYR